jgi:tetratricopeptide (TPR) repeat protein
MKNASTGSPRLRAERREVAEIERKEPLRRRLLVALGRQDMTPTSLAKAVGARKESVSRKLGELRREGMVVAAPEANDRRQVAYSLTRAGRAEMGRHLAFGASEKAPAPPGETEEVEFLREALVGAVAMRRRSNRLDDAMERFRDIEAQAREANAPDLALEAFAELITTQRQDCRLEERESAMEVLGQMSSGERGVEAELVHPAIAHLEYERGKGGDLGERDLTALERHLTAARSLFEALISERPHADTRPWRNRRAWSVVSLANNLRDQSRYEAALRQGASGLLMFEELDDDYGRAQCWLLFGFCLRLLRRFDAAWNCLDQALTLATGQGNSFERAMAYCLVQMGEVRRCQGETGEARELLGAALERSEYLELHVAQAFATSALAATEFQDQQLEDAQRTLRSAQSIFNSCKHSEGIALNARRQATVARHLSAGGVRPDEPEVKRLIATAEDIYFDLGSPAGVAACEIERGWMRKISPDCGAVDEIVDRLIQMIDDDDERETLESDPWVPKVLREFSKEVGEPLEKRAKNVCAESNRNLAKTGERGMQSVSEVAGELAGAGKAQPTTPVVEMGGESSRKEVPLELAAA